MADTGHIIIFDKENPDHGELAKNELKSVHYEMNVNSTFCNHWRISFAYREIFQNFLDQCARNNADNPTWNGIVVEKEENGYLFRNEHRELGRIIFYKEITNKSGIVQFTSSRLKKYEDTPKGGVRFVNYDTHIRAGRDIMRFGHSDKKGVANQSGRFGEGMKAAMAAFVNHRCKVDILGLIRHTVNNQNVYVPEFWHVYKKSKKVMVNMRRQIFKNPNVHTFDVCIYYDANNAPAPFDLESILFPRPLRDLGNRGQWFLDDPSQNGRLYVKNMFVENVKVPGILNLDLPLGRDRNVASHNRLVRAVARCIDQYDECIVGKPFANFVFTYLLCKQRDMYDVIYDAIPHFSKETCARVFAQFDGCPILPQHVNEYGITFALEDETFFKIVQDPHVWQMLNYDGVHIKAEHAKAVASLTSDDISVDAPWFARLVDMFSGTYQIAAYTSYNHFDYIITDDSIHIYSRIIIKKCPSFHTLLSYLMGIIYKHNINIDIAELFQKICTPPTIVISDDDDDDVVADDEQPPPLIKVPTTTTTTSSSSSATPTPPPPQLQQKQVQPDLSAYRPKNNVRNDADDVCFLQPTVIPKTMLDRMIDAYYDPAPQQQQQRSRKRQRR